MKLRILLCIVGFAFIQSAQAQQPISVSLAECSVIFNVMSITAEQKGKPAKQINGMREASAALKQGAIIEAQAEGQPDGTTYINSKMPALIQKWDMRWLSVSTADLIKNMPENMEWVQYCGKLGKDRGLLPIAPQ